MWTDVVTALPFTQLTYGALLQFAVTGVTGYFASSGSEASAIA